jgi:hypothetical protein
MVVASCRVAAIKENAGRRPRWKLLTDMGLLGGYGVGSEIRCVGRDTETAMRQTARLGDH